jgi:hypothetical protein
VYWVPELTADPPSVGHCHRYPPGVFVNPQTGVIVQKFPATDPHHWCGEWSHDDSRVRAALSEVLARSQQN